MSIRFYFCVFLQRRLCAPKKEFLLSSALKCGESFEINMLRIISPDTFYGIQVNESILLVTN